MTEIKIGGRKIPLFYSVYEMIAIQKEIGCTAFQLKDDVFGKKRRYFYVQNEEMACKLCMAGARLGWQQHVVGTG